MKKIIAIMVIITMAFVSIPAVTADNGEWPCYDEPDLHNIETIAQVAGVPSGGGGGTGEPTGIDDPNSNNGPPIIKVKWEYDLGPGPHDGFAHDSCIEPGLQVAPLPNRFVLVGYYAVVTDPQGKDHVDHVYADIWHPDGEFKYQIELTRIGFEDTVYDKTVALGIWDHVIRNHRDIITVNDDWAMGLDPGINWWDDVRDELNEPLAYMYYGEALLSYCQPGGYYTVGVRAHDHYSAWCDYLFNQFWYIPTAAIQIDFRTVDYGIVAESFDQWVGGDYDMDTPHKPTVRNIGNCPVELWVIQNDMDFGKTDGRWNVQFDAQLTADEINRVYYFPDILTRIPGILDLCTMEKLDFSIHVFKGLPNIPYSGRMGLYAYIDDQSFVWGTRPEFIGDAPNGVPQNILP
jgi:hypothetical protein